MSKFSVFFWLVFIAVALNMQSLFASTLEETFKKQIQFEAGGMVSLENTNGNIEVEGWDKAEVLIEAQKKVKASGRESAEKLMDQVEVEVTQEGNRMEIRTHLPSRSSGGFLDWIFGGGANASVEYRVYVPDNSDVELHTTNGNVHLTDISGKFNLKTTNGNIEAESLEGSGDCETTNGTVNVELAELAGGTDSNFSTTNGSIKVYLPEDVQCSVSAKTTNGSIDSDFDLTVRGKYNSKNMHGRINGGGNSELELHTTNGSIKIRKK